VSCIDELLLRCGRMQEPHDNQGRNGKSKQNAEAGSALCRAIRPLKKGPRYLSLSAAAACTCVQRHTCTWLQRHSCGLAHLHGPMRVSITFSNDCSSNIAAQFMVLFLVRHCCRRATSL